MKKFFITGLITLLPIALTLMITLWLFEFLTEPLVGLTESIILHFEQTWGLDSLHHQPLALFFSRLLALLILIGSIFVLGILARRFVLNFLLRITDRIFSKIPLIRSIYRVSHDMTKAFFSDSKKTFQRTVLMPFPHHEALAIGFVTGETPPFFKEISQSDLVVFVPTAPHPMSGFVLLTPKNLTFPVNISTEEAFKFILSCGVIHPGDKPEVQSE